MLPMPRTERTTTISRSSKPLRRNLFVHGVWNHDLRWGFLARCRNIPGDASFRFADHSRTGHTGVNGTDLTQPSG